VGFRNVHAGAALLFIPRKKKNMVEGLSLPTFFLEYYTFLGKKSTISLFIYLQNIIFAVEKK